MSLKRLLSEVRDCTVCRDLPLGPKPILRAGSKARILVIGQAPGIRVHESGIPWNDPSGDRLRDWLGVDLDTFYDENRFAIVPMGFCYPGRGKSGDLPPRPECAPQWHARVLEELPKIRLRILAGKYAHDYYLAGRSKATLTETVRSAKEFGNGVVPLPHPSPRNNFWLHKNPWFEPTMIPRLRELVRAALE